jgi:hypothetical protein
MEVVVVRGMVQGMGEEGWVMAVVGWVMVQGMEVEGWVMVQGMEVVG